MRTFQNTHKCHMTIQKRQTYFVSCHRSQETILSNEAPVAQNSAFDFFDGRIDVSKMTFVCSVLKFML